MTDSWVEVHVKGDMISRYWVSWEDELGARGLIIQLQSDTGAVVRHLFPQGTVEAVTSSTSPQGVHRVCINPTFLIDSVVFEFGSAEDALLFHWAVVSALTREKS